MSGKAAIVMAPKVKGDRGSMLPGRLCGNIPSSILADVYGRKPLLVGGLMCIATGSWAEGWFADLARGVRGVGRATASFASEPRHCGGGLLLGLRAADDTSPGRGPGGGLHLHLGRPRSERSERSEARSEAEALCFKGEALAEACTSRTSHTL